MLRWSIERLLKFKEVFGPRLQSAVLKSEERLAAAAPEDTEAAELLDRPSDWDSSVLNGRLLGMLVWLRALDLGASAAAVASRFGVPIEEGPVA